MADAKIINYGQQIGAGSTAIPDNNSTALEIEGVDAKDYIVIDTTDGSEKVTLKAGTNATLAVTASGAIALGTNPDDATQNIAIGDSDALDTITTGESNIIIGSSADNYKLTTGGKNVFIGHKAGEDMQGAQNAVHIGFEAGAITNNSSNVFVGAYAGENATGFEGVAIGKNAHQNCTGDKNVAVGTQALDASGAAANSVAVGFQALTAATGDYNSAVGFQAGNGVSSGGGNLLLGYQADCDGSANYQIAIGFQVSTAAASTAAIGDATRTATLNFGLAGQSWSTTSDERIKENVQDSRLGLDFINALRPITYTEINPEDWPEDIRPHVYFDREKTRTNENGEQETYIEPAKEREATSGVVVDGLMAQEVKAAADAEGASFSGWEQQPNGLQRLQYEKFVLPLIKAVQELSRKLEDAEARIGFLEADAEA